MTRKHWKLAALLLLAGLGIWFLLTWYAEKGEYTRFTEQDVVRAQRELGAVPVLVDTPPKAVPLTSALRVAVGSLGLREEQNGQAGDLLLARLRNAKGIELIERQVMKPILEELGLNLSGLVRAKDAIRAGRLLRADWFLLGTPLQLNTSNLVVVRVVDARTGVFRDTGVFAAGNGLETLADQLATFLLQCRQRAAAGQAPVYLAIGAFNDLSLNNRLADFPTQLRSYLAAAYRGSDITLLERDYAETLLQEIRLDSAGLTENSGTNGAVMQTAFWLLEGDYQSYNQEVELELRLRRMFGLSKIVPPIRQPAGESLFQQVRRALDQEIRHQPGAVVLSRVSETRAQMQRGKELTRFNLQDSWGEPYQALTGQQEARLQQRKLQEAIRAFQAALLLEPTNREARVYLAECYCRSLVGRLEEGRNLFRDVYEELPLDAWHQAAARRLIASFHWGSPEEKFQWFSRAEQQSGNPHSKAFYQAEAAAAQEQVLRRQGAAQAQPDTLAERKLLADIRSGLSLLEDKSGTMSDDFGMDDYVRFFKPDKALGGRKLAGFLPQLTNDFPKLTAHLTAAALKYQTETNNPVLPRFERELAACREHPEKVFALSHFCSLARYGAYDWCLAHGRPEVAAQILDVVQQCARADRRVTFGDEDHLAQAFAYLQAQDWAKALAIFETYSNLPVAMTRGAGPWGRAFEPVLMASEAANCRRHLGLPVSSDPRQFELETNLVAFKGPFAFATSTDGLWIAANDHLLHLDFDLHTNFSASLPCSDSFAVNCVLVGASNVWIGTDGGGLMAFDKQTRQTVRYGEEEGLLSDVVSSLCLEEDRLWIGYGVKNGPYGIDGSRKQTGGLGAYNWRAKQFRAFTPSLAQAGGFARSSFVPTPAGPPGRSVAAVVLGPDQDVWVSTWPLKRLRVTANAWESFPEAGYPSALLANTKYLFVGGFAYPAGRAQRGPLGIKILDFAGRQWRSFPEFGPLPGGMVSALAFEGEHLWVAGMGYLAKINPERNELLHYGYLRAFAVDQLELGGGYIWARCDRTLHRARLPAR